MGIVVYFVDGKWKIRETFCLRYIVSGRVDFEFLDFSRFFLYIFWGSDTGWGNGFWVF